MTDNSLGLIYLDHNATSPSTRSHLQRLTQLLENCSGNPSSPHSVGRGAHVGISEVRRSLARALGFDPSEIVFLSGGSEANNLGTSGVVHTVLSPIRSAHVIRSAIEHPSIAEPLAFLEKTQGISLSVLPVNSCGTLAAADVIASLRPETALVTLMAANNEIGTLLPVQEFAHWLHRRRWGTPQELAVPHPLDRFLDERVSRETLQSLHFHVDSVQVFGKIPFSEWMSLGIDSLSVCAHKLGGLSGIGALALRRGRKFQPSILGGAQERSRRAGTENLAGVLSFGLVIEQISSSEWWQQVERMRGEMQTLRLQLSQYQSVLFNSPENNILPNTLNFCIQNSRRRGEDVLIELDMQGVCASSGSACSSGANLPSKVLLALGRSEEQAKNSIRLSLGVGLSKSQLDRASIILERCLA